MPLGAKTAPVYFLSEEMVDELMMSMTEKVLVTGSNSPMLSAAKEAQ